MGATTREIHFVCDAVDCGEKGYVQFIGETTATVSELLNMHVLPSGWHAHIGLIYCQKHVVELKDK